MKKGRRSPYSRGWYTGKPLAADFLILSGRIRPGFTPIIPDEPPASHEHHLNPPGQPLLIQNEIMLFTNDIITMIWDAQGYGNVAVWDDGTVKVIDPGQVPL
jgi:hypothetical protein